MVHLVMLLFTYQGEGVISMEALPFHPATVISKFLVNAFTYIDISSVPPHGFLI